MNKPPCACPPSRSRRRATFGLRSLAASGAAWFASAALTLAATTGALSTSTLTNIGFQQRLNVQVPLHLTFQDETGQTVALSRYCRAQPVILVLGYYECPMLCSLVLNGLVEGLMPLKSAVGPDFTVVCVSIDPGEGPDLAQRKKATYVSRYARSEAAEGWHFLTGPERESRALAEAVGFGYAYDAALDQYAHPSGIVILTPEGRTAQYLLGVSYAPQDLNAGLKAAAAGRIGSPVQRLVLLCFPNMPLTGRHSATIMTGLRAFGILSVLGLAGFIVRCVRRDLRRAAAPATPQEAR